MPAALPPLPMDGGTYRLSTKGTSWELEQQTAEPGVAEPTPPPAQDDAISDKEAPSPGEG